MIPAAILCAADKRDVLVILEQLNLQFPDYAVETVDSGVALLEQIEKLARWGVDIALTIVEQGMLDTRSAQRLSELQHRYPQILVVLLTQSDAENPDVNVASNGIYRYLHAPWTEADLHQTVRDALAQSHRAKPPNPVSEQSRAFQIQSQAQNLLQTLVEHSPIAVAVLDCDLRYLLVSQRWYTDYRLGEQSIIGRSHYDVFPELPEQWKAAHQRCLSGTVEQMQADQFVQADGSTAQVQWEIRPWSTDQQEMGGIILYTQMITNRQQTDADLVQSEARLTLAQRVAHLGYWEFDLETQEILWSAELLQLHSREPGQGAISYAELPQIIHPDDWQVLEAATNTAIADGIPYEVEYRILHADGSVHYMMVRGEAIRNNQGQIVKLAGTWIDQTSTKLAQIALQESEARNRAILAAVPDIMAVIDAEGYFVNLSFNRFPGEAIPGEPGEHISEVLPPAAVVSCLQAIQQALKTGEVQTYEQQIPFEDCIQYEEVRVVPYQPDQVLRIVRDITEQKQIELSLQQSEAKQKALINALPDLILHIRGDGVYLSFIAPSTFNMIRNIKDIIGARVEQNLPPDMAEKRMNAIRAALQTGELQIYEQEVIVNGTAQVEECRIVACGNDEVLVIVRDITQRKRAEQVLQQLNEELEQRVQQRTQDLLASQSQLAEKEQFLRGIFEGTSNPIFVVDVREDGTFEYTGWNWGCEKALGVNSVVAIGKSPQEVFPGELGIAFENHYRDCYETRKVTRYEECLTLETGEVWFLTLLTPLKNAERQVYRIIGSAFDISDRKQAERALQEAQWFAQSVTDSTPNLVYIYDLQQSCNLYVNQAVNTVLGYSPGLLQALGRNFLDRLFHPDDLVQLAQMYEQVKSLADSEIIEVEYRMCHADGNWRWLFDRISVFKRDDSGNVIQLIGTAQDITDRKLSETTLAEQNTVL